MLQFDLPNPLNKDEFKILKKLRTKTTEVQNFAVYV